MSEILTASEVGKELHLTPRQVMIGIQNGSMPIGVVIPPEKEGELWKARIIRKRYQMWLNGEI